MSENVSYTCVKCGKTIEAPQVPEQDIICCGKEMVPQPVCTTQAVAEQYRFSDDNEPCDDARQGQRKDSEG